MDFDVSAAERTRKGFSGNYSKVPWWTRDGKVNDGVRQVFTKFFRKRAGKSIRKIVKADFAGEYSEDFLDPSGGLLLVMNERDQQCQVTVRRVKGIMEGHLTLE